MPEENNLGIKLTQQRSWRKQTKQKGKKFPPRPKSEIGTKDTRSDNT